ncbi:SMI1 / KNR4 family (SUKH-1) [Peptostreptococcaceae bacterium pGA-8]|nr:SMI1 / KNR4 family (SUKH-1) [Peptostreptococcaceae bacterium pGA-8]
MYNKNEILDRLNSFKNRVDELGGITRELVCKEIAKEEDILKLERDLGYKLPIEFRQALKELSSHIAFFWSIYNEEKELISLPSELVEIFCGELYFGIDLVPVFEEIRLGWIDIYHDYDNPYDRVFHNKLAFQEVGNGDLLAIDLEKESYGRVIYLSHDGSDLHGYVMANSFAEFLEEYTKLGCVGGEDWQWEVFTNHQTTPIDSTCENAKKWLEIIGLY